LCSCLYGKNVLLLLMCDMGIDYDRFGGMVRFKGGLGVREGSIE